MHGEGTKSAQFISKILISSTVFGKLLWSLYSKIYVKTLKRKLQLDIGGNIFRNIVSPLGGREGQSSASSV